MSKWKYAYNVDSAMCIIFRNSRKSLCNVTSKIETVFQHTQNRRAKPKWQKSVVKKRASKRTVAIRAAVLPDGDGSLATQPPQKRPLSPALREDDPFRRQRRFDSKSKPAFARMCIRVISLLLALGRVDARRSILCGLLFDEIVLLLTYFICVIEFNEFWKLV